MARKAELKQRFNTMITLEYEDYQAFIKMIGEGNFSNEIRAFVKDRINLEKNEQAQAVDPLNLTGCLKKPYNNNTRQSTLFESFAQNDHRDDIVKYIKSIKNTTQLNKIEQNCKCMLKVSEVHRRNIIAAASIGR